MAIVSRPPVTDPVAFDEFSCNIVHDNPDTPDRLKPDVKFVRQVSTSFEIEMHDGKRIRFWGFYDPDDNSDLRKQWPSKAIRVQEGQVVHVELKSSTSTHTIHMHGIDPSPMNDGVGHTSFEVSGHYTYQFRASNPGTYFYHCHKNTALHFELGMYGPLIVDPRILVHPETGRRYLFNPHPGDDPAVKLEDVLYDREAIWAFDDVDPRWRELGHDAGLCNEDAGLNIIEPKYFLISGVPSHRTERDTRVVVRAKAGETVLARVNNAAYSFLEFSVEPPAGVPLDAVIAEADGRPLRQNPALRSFSAPIPLAAGERLELLTSQRRSILFRNLEPGEYVVRGVFRDWLAKRKVGEAMTKIIVEPNGAAARPRRSRR